MNWLSGPRSDSDMTSLFAKIDCLSVRFPSSMTRLLQVDENKRVIGEGAT